MSYEEDEEALIRLYGLDDESAPVKAPRLRRRKSERQKRKSSTISRAEAAGMLRVCNNNEVPTNTTC